MDPFDDLGPNAGDRVAQHRSGAVRVVGCGDLEQRLVVRRVIFYLTRIYTIFKNLYI